MKYVPDAFMWLKQFWAIFTAKEDECCLEPHFLKVAFGVNCEVLVSFPLSSCFKVMSAFLFSTT